MPSLSHCVLNLCLARFAFPQSNVVRKEVDELLADRLAEAAENLAAFIEYKRAHP